MATLFINGSTGNILYRMNMCLAFVGCGVFMIAVGNLCPHKYDMKDISSQSVLQNAAKEGIKAAAHGIKVGAKAAVENQEVLVEMKDKFSQEKPLL